MGNTKSTIIKQETVYKHYPTPVTKIQINKLGKTEFQQGFILDSLSYGVGLEWIRCNNMKPGLYHVNCDLIRPNSSLSCKTGMLGASYHLLSFYIDKDSYQSRPSEILYLQVYKTAITDITITITDETGEAITSGDVNIDLVLAHLN